MLSPILEKLVLNGWAQFKIVNIAYGSFEQIEVPKGGLAIINQIIWNHFINPIKDFDQGVTWGEFFLSNEYQLKIESDQKINYYQFRNKISWANNNALNPIDLTAAIDKTKFDKYFIQEPNPAPVILPTYLTVQEFLQLTISRNAFFPSMVGTYNLMAPVSNQQNAPAGMKDSKVILDLNMTSGGGSNMHYVPSGFQNSAVAVSNTKTNQYAVAISKAVPGNYESNLQNLDTASATSSARNPFTNFPLLSIGIVIINKNHTDKIKAG